MDQTNRNVPPRFLEDFGLKVTGITPRQHRRRGFQTFESPHSLKRQPGGGPASGWLSFEPGWPRGRSVGGLDLLPTQRSGAMSPAPRR